MKTRYTEEERALLLAAVQYADKSGIPHTRVALCLSGLMNKPEATLYNQLGEIAKTMSALASGAIDDVNVDALFEAEVQQDENLDTRIGEVVNARVVSVNSYGALCVVANTTRTLLLHISEVADAYISDMNEYVGIGDTFPAMLIIGAKDRLALSTRRVKPLRSKADAAKA